MYCKQCGNKLQEQDSKCASCGAKFGKGNRFCLFCGEKRESNATACPACNHSYSEFVAFTAAKPENKTVETKQPDKPTQETPAIQAQPKQENGQKPVQTPEKPAMRENDRLVTPTQPKTQLKRPNKIENIPQFGGNSSLQKIFTNVTAKEMASRAIFESICGEQEEEVSAEQKRPVETVQSKPEPKPEPKPELKPEISKMAKQVVEGKTVPNVRANTPPKTDVAAVSTQPSGLVSNAKNSQRVCPVSTENKQDGLASDMPLPQPKKNGNVFLDAMALCGIVFALVFILSTGQKALCSCIFAFCFSLVGLFSKKYKVLALSGILIAVVVLAVSLLTTGIIAVNMLV